MTVAEMSSPPMLMVSLDDYPIRHDPAKEMQNGCWIQHRVLTMAWKPADGAARAGLAFQVYDPQHDTDAKTISQFIQDHRGVAVPENAVMTTPWDIPLPPPAGAAGGNPQRLHVLQHAQNLDWEFTPGHPGVRSMEEIYDQDCSLYFVDRDGQVSGPGGNAPAGCSMVYWSVIGRQAATPRGFNFYITLIDPLSGKRIPTVFDPSVPDGGGASIP